MERVANEESIPRECVLQKNLIEHVMGLSEVVSFAIKSDELRSKEIIKNCRGEDEPGMELLCLADKAVVGAMLNEVAEQSIINWVVDTWQAKDKCSNGGVRGLLMKL
ncbi:hypothetical protein ACH5RR_004797 [Cinchona calisaya]|uniref:Uncharacterized protein n=1 Tax=Cinchona calisaya TaxID=153742 RepID=A0ABD3AYR5_9GENT